MAWLECSLCMKSLQFGSTHVGTTKIWQIFSKESLFLRSDFFFFHFDTDSIFFSLGRKWYFLPPKRSDKKHNKLFYARIYFFCLKNFSMKETLLGTILESSGCVSYFSDFLIFHNTGLKGKRRVNITGVILIFFNNYWLGQLPL